MHNVLCVTETVLLMHDEDNKYFEEKSLLIYYVFFIFRIFIDFIVFLLIVCKKNHL